MGKPNNIKTRTGQKLPQANHDKSLTPVFQDEVHFQIPDNNNEKKEVRQQTQYQILTPMLPIFQL